MNNFTPHTNHYGETEYHALGRYCEECNRGHTVIYKIKNGSWWVQNGPHTVSYSDEQVAIENAMKLVA